ncbi:MAG: hypothetical protein ISS19_10955 [Bacteroidales bacterium]|nr:hypothetical protein [Bacteroidales bacterium]
MNRLFIFFILILLAFGCTDDETEAPSYISGNQVNAIYIDEDGIRWFGTGNGISSFDGKVWKNYDVGDGLPSNYIRDIDIRQISSGTQLLAGTNNGIGIVNMTFNIIKSIVTGDTLNSGLRSNNVFTLMQDKIGGTWFGTMEGLSVQFHNNWLISETDSLIKDYLITDIAPGPDTISFVCFYGQGIALMDLDVDAVTTVTYYKWPLSPLPSMNIQAIYVDGYHYQWIGTDNGLAFHGNFDPAKEWIHYYESDGLIDNNVLSVKSDNNRITWVGTVSGVSRFDGQDWTNYTVEDGLAGDIVYCIAIDHDNSVWFGTNNGASHFLGDEWITYRKEQ